MPLSMYQASVPPFMQMLAALSGVLEKAETHADARKIEPAALLQDRLFPDMWPLVRQVQIACDFAKGVAARLAGIDPPVHEDTERTFAELRARIEKTLDFLRALNADQIDGSEGRDITIKLGGKPVTFKGQTYLLHFALPNFYFHCTTAYAILRHNGVELGKRDFVGKVPGL
ncbi:MAG TPA: DUF1993 domain-containing protein [Hyphomicrobiaceae bacterium]|nr:DUF1993 domain-containing protein [Hyphomicrobiaceae bacterium]